MKRLKHGLGRKKKVIPVSNIAGAVCGSCQTDIPRQSTGWVQYGEKTGTGVIWYPNILWCGEIECYHGLEEKIRERRRLVKEQLRKK